MHGEEKYTINLSRDASREGSIKEILIKCVLFVLIYFTTLSVRWEDNLQMDVKKI
jgi:hypothetical protein